MACVIAGRPASRLREFRYRRTILASARWTLTAADIDASQRPGWDKGLRAWTDRWHVPSRIVLRQGELRLPLDLDDKLDSEILRSRLQHASQLELTEAGKPGATGWIGRPAELLVTLTRK